LRPLGRRLEPSDPGGPDGIGLALADGAAPSERCHLYMRVWLVLGWPAFAGVGAIFFPMIDKPA